MNIEEAIIKRRALYPEIYKVDAPIPVAVLEQMLHLANHAPTHKRTEAWRFKVLHTDGSKANLGKILADGYKANTATESFSEKKYEKTLAKAQRSGAVIALCLERLEDSPVPEWEDLASLAMSVQNMWLFATSREIGAYWSSPKTIHSQAIREFLGLSESEKCYGFLYLGYHNLEALPAAIRSPWQGKTTWL
jgi:nitroreductase